MSNSLGGVAGSPVFQKVQASWGDFNFNKLRNLAGAQDENTFFDGFVDIGFNADVDSSCRAAVLGAAMTSFDPRIYRKAKEGLERLSGRVTLEQFLRRMTESMTELDMLSWVIGGEVVAGVLDLRLGVSVSKIEPAAVAARGPIISGLAVAERDLSAARNVPASVPVTELARGYLAEADLRYRAGMKPRLQKLEVPPESLLREAGVPNAVPEALSPGGKTDTFATTRDVKLLSDLSIPIPKKLSDEVRLDTRLCVGREGLCADTGALAPRWRRLIPGVSVDGLNANTVGPLAAPIVPGPTMKASDIPASKMPLTMILERAMPGGQSDHDHKTGDDAR